MGINLVALISDSIATICELLRARKQPVPSEVSSNSPTSAGAIFPQIDCALDSAYRSDTPTSVSTASEIATPTLPPSGSPIWPSMTKGGVEPVRLTIGSYQLDRHDENLLQMNLLKLELEKIARMIDSFEGHFLGGTRMMDSGTFGTKSLEPYQISAIKPGEFEVTATDHQDQHMVAELTRYLNSRLWTGFEALQT